MKRLILPVALFCVISACSKDEKGTQQTNMQILTAAAWKYDTAGIDADGNGVIDNPVPNGYILPCHKDNTLTFRTDETGTVDEGALKCSQTDPQSTNFSWSFNNNQNIINFSDTIFGAISGDVTIRRLTATELVLSKEVNVGPLSVPALIRLKH